MRALLEDDEYSVEDDLSPKRSFTHYLSNGIFPPHGVAWNASYSQIGLRFLWQTYVRNIDPTMKALHVPTTQLVIDDVLSGSVQISKSTYCLLAAIKFAAVTSLTDEQCWAALNSSRKPLLDLFGSEVQAALDAANFLSKHGIVTLQAYAIYQVRFLDDTHVSMIKLMRNSFATGDTNIPTPRGWPPELQSVLHSRLAYIVMVL